jgi:transposase
MRARQRLSKLLLRHGLVWQQSAWTRAHQRWLQGLRWEQPWVRVAFDEALGALGAVLGSRRAVTGWTARSSSRPTGVGAAGGSAGLSAWGWGADRGRAGGGGGDWQRLSGATIGAYLGLVPSEVPSEQSSGGQRGQRVQGPITKTGKTGKTGRTGKTGNTRARRLLVEAAWHHRKPYRASQALRARQAGQPAVVRQRAERGNHRLHQRWRRLDARGKRSTISAVAVARELAGWCWSLAVMDA